jgi:hypothetical protein
VAKTKTVKFYSVVCNVLTVSYSVEMIRPTCTITGALLMMWMEATMSLAPQESVSSTANKKFKTVRNIPHG